MNTALFYKKLVEKPTLVKFFVEDGHIRGRLTKGYDRGKIVCPVTLVAYTVTGEYFAEWDYIEAARLIKLRRREANKITLASDFPQHHPKVREKLLKVTKAKPV